MADLKATLLDFFSIVFADVSFIWHVHGRP